MYISKIIIREFLEYKKNAVSQKLRIRFVSHIAREEKCRWYRLMFIPSYETHDRRSSLS